MTPAVPLAGEILEMATATKDSPEAGLSHVDAAGRANMVDVADKAATRRRAVARGEVFMAPATLAAIIDRTTPKGDVLAVARVAGIMAAKRTQDLIPLCHSLPLDGVRVWFRSAIDKLEIEAEVTVTARTGAEMEALVAVSATGLTIYDMCKAIDRGMVLAGVRLVRKEGGRSGVWQREGEQEWTEHM
jgi:cyclic pyranopterin phosphate synthase